MAFSSVSEFLAMGRHGFYVWLSYGLTAVIVVINIVQPIVRKRQLIKQHIQRLRREKKHAPTT